MSTDSTDLTFVRCPACRSLVPAVSSRCRMCGAALDASAAAAKEEPRVSRVRQRTMSQPGSELSSAVNQAREDADSDSVSVAAPSFEAMEEVPVTIPTPVVEADPLSAFVEEVREEPVQQEVAVQVERAPIPETPVRAAPQVPEAPPMSREPAPPPPSPSRSERKGNLVFKGDKDAGQPASQPETPRQEPKREKPQKENRPPQPQREERERRNEQPVQPRTPEPQVVSRNAETPRIDPGEIPGRLVGWLVSYADPDGTAFELREGRFFIVRDRLRESDVVFDESGISTPHALMKISAAKGVYIQDLMSETGTFIRRSGGESYQREDEPCKLAHGDWIRLGS